MKKTYMTPIVNVESAQPTNIICVILTSMVAAAAMAMPMLLRPIGICGVTNKKDKIISVNKAWLVAKLATFSFRISHV